MPQLLKMSNINFYEIEKMKGIQSGAGIIIYENMCNVGCIVLEFQIGLAKCRIIYINVIVNFNFYDNMNCTSIWKRFGYDNKYFAEVQTFSFSLYLKKTKSSVY